MASRPSVELVDDTAAALLASISRLTRQLRHRSSGGDLSVSEAAVLARLAADSPSTAADLARAEQIRPQSMGTIVMALEARGLVKRSKDRGDARRVLLA